MTHTFSMYNHHTYDVSQRLSLSIFNERDIHSIGRHRGSTSLRAKENRVSFVADAERFRVGSFATRAIFDNNLVSLPHCWFKRQSSCGAEREKKKGKTEKEKDMLLQRPGGCWRERVRKTSLGLRYVYVSYIVIKGWFWRWRKE